MNVKNCWRSLLYVDVSLQQGNVEKFEKLIKMVNIEEENLHIFWTSWGISMKVSGKMWVMRILKVTKKQGSILSLKNTFLEKPHGEGSNSSPNIFRVKVKFLQFLHLPHPTSLPPPPISFNIKHRTLVHILTTVFVVYAHGLIKIFELSRGFIEVETPT